MHGLTEFCSQVRQFAQARIRPLARQLDDSNVFPKQLHQAMGEAGLLDMSAAGSAGQAGDLAVGGVVEISRACASVGNFVQNVLWAREFLTKYGNEEQVQLAARLGTGQSICAIAITEPDAGSDAGGLSMSATERPGGYVLDGVKSFVTFGSVCDHVLVFARTSPGAGKDGLTAFCLARDRAGVEVGRPDHLIGLRGLGTCTIRFHGCQVGSDEVVGAVGKGFQQMADCLVTGRIAVAAMALGIGLEAIDVATRHARSRQQFGRPLAKFQSIQFLWADMQARADSVGALLYQVARMDNTPDRVRLAAEVKLLASELAMSCAIHCTQTLGGSGCLVGSASERLMRDAKVTQIIEGTSEIQKLIISREMFSCAA